MATIERDAADPRRADPYRADPPGTEFLRARPAPDDHDMARGEPGFALPRAAMNMRRVATAIRANAVLIGAIIAGFLLLALVLTMLATPAPFRAEADRIAAQAALEAGDRSAALAAARQAVARDPADARPLGLLGEAALASGDRRLARRAFTVSASMGWREPLTQIYWLSAKLETGDFAAAGPHLDAFLRQAPGYPLRGVYLAPFDARPAGRAQLAELLARRPAWATRYFADTIDPASGDPLARSEVARLLASTHGVRDCALVAPVLEALLRFGRDTRAHALYRLHCASPGEAETPVDAGFERADPANPPTALDWHFPGEGAIGITAGPAPGMRGRALTVSSTAPITMVFAAAEPLALAPGSYRLTWRARDARGAPSPAIDVALSCAPAGARLAGEAARRRREGPFRRRRDRSGKLRTPVAVARLSRAARMRSASTISPSQLALQRTRLPHIDSGSCRPINSGGLRSASDRARTRRN